MIAVGRKMKTVFAKPVRENFGSGGFAAVMTKVRGGKR